MPADLPRRQTTWQLRPVRASRENAIRITPGSWLASSSIVIFAPEVEMSWTRQCRAANPPSRVIQACCDSNLRAARFLGGGMDEKSPTPATVGNPNKPLKSPPNDPGVGTVHRPQKTFPNGLPAGPNATIRSPAAAAGHDSCGPRPCRQKRRGFAFAPFVYRLGRHPFTVERAVRFR